jgi:hypothetical protein
MTRNKAHAQHLDCAQFLLLVDHIFLQHHTRRSSILIPEDMRFVYTHCAWLVDQPPTKYIARWSRIIIAEVHRPIAL